MSDRPTIPGVELLEEVGRGGFGVVWRGRCEDGQRVAVKVARKVSHGARFAREAAALERVGPPFVPQLHRAGKLDDGHSYLVMEFLEGATLEAEIEALEAPMSVEAAVSMIDSLLDCLEAVHDKGFVHRDLKPANIFKSGDRIRVMDFGLARFDDGVDLTRTGVIVGTVAYASPEQLAGASEIDGRADLYSVGVILYQLLSLKVPFDGQPTEIERGHLMLRPPTLESSVTVSAALTRLLADLLAKDPDRRPASAKQARVRLRSLDGAEGQTTTSARVSSKRLGGGAEPVVLLSCAMDKGALGDVSKVIKKHRGFIARSRGDRTVSVFCARLADEPVTAALAAGRELIAQGRANVALHVAELLVRFGRGGSTTAYGNAIEHPDEWVARATGSNLRVTDELAALAPETRANASEMLLPPLFGRDEILSELEDATRSAMAGDAELVTVIGSPGAGKTRMADEAARLADEHGAKLIRLHGRKATAVRLMSELDGSTEQDAPREMLRQMASTCLRSLAVTAPVAVIVDDAHLADVALLDALELSTSAADELRLLVVVAADRNLEQARPNWARGADRFRTLVLEALDDEAASGLAAHHLQPADYPPTTVLRRLAEWSGRNPLLLGELARSLKSMGAIVKREGSDSYYVTTDVLDRLPTSRAAQWLESQKLGLMSPDVASFARLAALVGTVVDVAELESILSSVDRGGGAASPIDPSVGTAELALVGWLVKTNEGAYEWKREATRDAIYRLIRRPDAEILHRYALEFADAIGDTRRVAYHAAECGETERAAAALLELARSAYENREHVACEQLASRAMLLQPDDHSVQANGLLLRGRARYRFNRASDAVSDLETAAELFESLGEGAQAARSLLELATAHDWMYAFEPAKVAVEQAALLLVSEPDHGLEAALVVARGRAAWRAGDAESASSLLEQCA